jgi:general secretion pathway protein I
MARHPQRLGFTILEVMIAIVILAVGLSSLFASEAGAVRVAQRARTTTVATLLARCKMAEIEEKLAKDGFTTNAIDERDGCCEGAEHNGFNCEWKVDRIVLPELDTTPLDAAKRATDKFKGVSNNDERGASDAGVKGDTRSKGDAGSAALSDPAGTLMGSNGGGDMLASMLLEMSFPIMKPIIEENVRRVTVTVKWKEGSRDQSFDVVQFIVNESLGLVPTVDEDGEPVTPGTTPAGTQSTPATTPSTQSTPGAQTTGGVRR